MSSAEDIYDLRSKIKRQDLQAVTVEITIRCKEKKYIRVVNHWMAREVLEPPSLEIFNT